MEKSINYFWHEHPLLLTKHYDREIINCYVCGKVVRNSELAYACKQHQCIIRRSYSRVILHKRCAELPVILSHPSHPLHPLNLTDFRGLPAQRRGRRCNLCRTPLSSKVGYRCDSCDFNINVECTNPGLLKERVELQHPSHIHPLTLMRKQAFPFMCDGCGTDQDVDMAYVCNTCEYWVHATCASLPITLPQDSHQHHHHRLSLAFCFPMKHRRYKYKCDVCDKDFNMACWLYFCGDCRYFVHLKCVGSTTKQDVLSIGDVVQFPLSNDIFSSMLITPFVMREKGTIPHVNEMPRTIKMPQTTASYSYLFNFHKHPLSLVSEDDDEGKGKGKALVLNHHEEDDDEDEEMKLCEVCVTPISSPPYYQCSSACKYFIHLICSMLPNTLSSSSSSSSSTFQYGECPKTDDKNHKFAMYTSSKEMDETCSYICCDLCSYPTNGMMYICEECGMIMDVKCASLPTSITYASHPHHKLIMGRIGYTQRGSSYKCYHCSRYTITGSFGYSCSEDDCKFALDLKCTQLPLSVRKPEWDHHPLLLTFNAATDHPSDFFCEFCEGAMFPKKPMYHCRPCDQSYHFRCLETGSGRYRNVKFGRRFELDSVHPHPLRYNFITLKKWCDICHTEVYASLGFECVSCYFVVCVTCGDKVLAKKM